jgi:hypothetical protein
MRLLENIVTGKKHSEVKLSVEKSKEKVDHGSGDTSYTSVLVSLFAAASVRVY